jgi:SAM-dependent methyltransferase
MELEQFLSWMAVPSQTRLKDMKHGDGSGTWWGPLFGARAATWAQTWEGPEGWGAPVYTYVLDQVQVGPSTTLLDCGCGAGRFVRLAAERGASAAGIDASRDLVEIAAKQTPEADLRVGDLKALPWPDDAFDIVTGFSSFQFSDDHAGALAEARRVSQGDVWVIIPTRLDKSAIPQVFATLMPLLPSEARSILKRSGMYALSASGALDEVLVTAGMIPRSDETIGATTMFAGAAAAVEAFLSAGATELAVQYSGQSAVATALYDALTPFTGEGNQVSLPGWFRVVQAR